MHAMHPVAFWFSSVVVEHRPFVVQVPTLHAWCADFHRDGQFCLAFAFYDISNNRRLAVVLDGRHGDPRTGFEDCGDGIDCGFLKGNVMNNRI